MSDICSICGLNKNLCVCDVIAKEKQKIHLKVVERRYGKKITLVECSDSKNMDLKELAKNLKSYLACGGTIKGGIIELQGDHTKKVREELIKLGFNSDSIEQ